MIQDFMNHANRRAPSIGRIVHYQSHGSANGVYESTCRAAIVTDLCKDPDHESECLALAVVNPEGMFFKEHVPHDSFDYLGGSWHWPEIVPEKFSEGENHV